MNPNEHYLDEKVHVSSGVFNLFMAQWPSSPIAILVKQRRKETVT